MSAEILSKRTILVQPDRYIGWPTIVRTRDNELLVVFSGDRDRHICPFGKVQMIRSSDDGATWSGVETLCDCDIDDRDAGIIQTAEGTLLLNWFTSIAYASQFGKREEAYGKEITEGWKPYLVAAEDARSYNQLGCFVKRSTDNGATWEEPASLMAGSPHGPVQLKDGRILYVGRTLRDKYKRDAILVQESCDDGRTWTVLSRVPVPSEETMQFLSEPHMVEAEDGRLITMIRYCPPHPQRAETAYLHQSVSDDGGRTWSMAEPTDIWGFPPHLLRLEDGRLLCSIGHRKEPCTERAVVSEDNGRTWDAANPIELASAPNGDLGYPASTQLADGSIYTVYYQRERGEDKVTSLHATHWRLD